MSLAELIEAVARETGLPKTVVAKVLKSSNELILETLNAGEGVKLTGFGAFYVREVKPRPLFGGRQTGVARKSIRFRESRRRREMEKLGVELDDEATKTASTKRTCPKCGYNLIQDNPPKCEHCGTEPFEKRPAGK